jgi:hypothetical protein
MEKVDCSAIKLPSGEIFTGKRHCDCFKACYDAGKSHAAEIQGFMTSENRFVGRREAREIAEKAGQLIERASKGVILYSEDIY